MKGANRVNLGVVGPFEALQQLQQCREEEQPLEAPGLSGADIGLWVTHLTLKRVITSTE